MTMLHLNLETYSDHMVSYYADNSHLLTIGKNTECDTPNLMDVMIDHMTVSLKGLTPGSNMGVMDYEGNTVTFENVTGVFINREIEGMELSIYNGLGLDRMKLDKVRLFWINLK